MTKPITQDDSSISSIKAYTYLAFAVLIVWSILQTPLGKISDQRAKIIDLESEILQVKNDAQYQLDESNLFTLKLEQLFNRGDISKHANSADIAKELQNVFKEAASKSKANIQLMTPSRIERQQGLVEHNLEASFSIQSAEFENFLVTLSGAFPKPRISLVSLRPTSIYSNPLNNSAAKATLLNVQLNLAQLAIEGSSHFASLTIDKPIEKSPLTNTDALAALFSPSERQRLKNPSLDYYRLSAITVNDRSRSILLIDKETGVSKRLETDQSIMGWVLQEIRSNEAIFSKQEEKKSLKLN